MELKTKHLVAGGVLAALAHIAAALALLWSPERAGAVGVGVGGLDIALAPAGGVVGAPEVIEADEASELPAEATSEALPPAQSEPAQPDSAQPLAIDKAAELAPTASEAIPATDAIAAARLETVAAAETRPVSASVIAARAIATSPPNESASMTAPVVAEEGSAPGAPERAARPARRPNPPVEKVEDRGTSAGPRDMAIRPGETTGNPGPTTSPAATGDATQEGASDGASGGGDPGAKRDFFAEVTAHLQRHRRYPRRARARGQEGAGKLAFTLTADGRVEEVEVRTSTGHNLLDQEILDLIERAKPLPTPPDEFGVHALRMVIPITFSLQ